MKVVTWETLYYEDHGATLKHKCGKRIVTLSLLSFSLIFRPFYGISSFFGPSLFMAFLFFLFLTWDNALENYDHHTSLYLQLNDYNSMLEESMTLYGCLRRCIGICNESRVTSMKKLWTVALPQILCQLHDHASNMTMMNVSWWTEWWKVAWQYISEWLWKCHNR